MQARVLEPSDRTLAFTRSVLYLHTDPTRLCSQPVGQRTKAFKALLLPCCPPICTELS